MTKKMFNSKEEATKAINYVVAETATADETMQKASAIMGKEIRNWLIGFLCEGILGIIMLNLFKLDEYETIMYVVGFCIYLVIGYFLIIKTLGFKCLLSFFPTSKRYIEFSVRKAATDTKQALKSTLGIGLVGSVLCFFLLILFYLLGGLIILTFVLILPPLFLLVIKLRAKLKKNVLGKLKEKIPFSDANVCRV